MNSSDKNIRKTILNNFYRDNKVLDIAIKVLLLLSAVFEIIIAWISQHIINSIMSEDSVAILLRSALQAGIILFSGVILNYILPKLQNIFTRRFSLYIKNCMFEKLLEKDIVEFEKHNNGEYISVFQTDIPRLTVSYVSGIWIIIKSVATCVLGIGSMILMNGKIALLVFALQIVPVTLTLILGRELKVLEKATAESRGSFLSNVNDYIKGFRLIKTFACENTFAQKFTVYNNNVETSERAFRDKNIYISLMNSTMNYILIVGLLLVGGIETINKRMEIGTVVACFELFTLISTPLSSVTVQLNLVKTSKVLFTRIYNMFYSNKEQHRSTVLKSIKSIRLKNVSFSYDGYNNKLSDVTYTFEKNRKYAIIGNSGSGKTTLTKLMMGYYSDYSGEILINDNRVETIRPDDLCREMSLVQQDPFVFNDTLKNNITLGSDITNDEFNRAVFQAGLSDFITNHTEEYVCSENGTNISGGEKQRISISRALLKKSSVIFFDEATSSLDNITANEIENTILTLGQMCISISHHMSADVLQKYDEIILMENGKIIESGSYEKLEKNSDLFKMLYNLG